MTKYVLTKNEEGKNYKQLIFELPNDETAKKVCEAVFEKDKNDRLFIYVDIQDLELLNIYRKVDGVWIDLCGRG